MADSDPGQLLPLSDGIVALCDPELVKAVQRAEAPFAPQLLAWEERPHLGGGKARYEPGRYVSSDHMRREHALLRVTWDALFDDFRRRIEDGQIHLSGVQTRPEPQETRTSIPGVWAADYIFNFKDGSVSGNGRRYVAVRMSSKPLVAMSVAAEGVVPLPAAADESAADTTEAGPTPGALRRGGRPKAEPLIREALERHWEYVSGLARPSSGAVPIWNDIARRLHKRWAAEAKVGVGGKPVAEETVRKHLRDIYEDLEGEKAHSGANAQ